MKHIITLVLTSSLVLTCGTISAAAPNYQEVPQIESPMVREVSPEIDVPPVEVEIGEEEIEVEFPDATYVWNYLHELGYNDAVVAGIIGNMMVECGGHTLNFESTIETNIHYGICQWNKKYYPDVIGCPLEIQCDFLRDTIEYEINTFGYKYKKGFKYENFLQMTNEKDAALAFAKSYERCSKEEYKLRQKCATIAYEYFLG